MSEWKTATEWRTETEWVRRWADVLGGRRVEDGWMMGERVEEVGGCVSAHVGGPVGDGWES